MFTDFILNVKDVSSLRSVDKSQLSIRCYQPIAITCVGLLLVAKSKTSLNGHATKTAEIIVSKNTLTRYYLFSTQLSELQYSALKS